MPFVFRLPAPVLATLAALAVLGVAVAVLTATRGSSPAAAELAPATAVPRDTEGTIAVAEARLAEDP